MGSWSSQHLPEREGEFTGTQFSRPQWIHQPRLRDVCLYVSIYFVLSSPGPSQPGFIYTCSSWHSGVFTSPPAVESPINFLPSELLDEVYLWFAHFRCKQTSENFFFISKNQKSHNFSQ